MSSIDLVHWGGLDRLSNVEQSLKALETGGLMPPLATGPGLVPVLQADGTVLWKKSTADAELQRLLGLFAPLAGDIGVGLAANGVDYDFRFGLGNNHYWQAKIPQLSYYGGSYALHQMHSHADTEHALSKAVGDGSIVLGGGGWTGPTVNTGVYNGNYYWASATTSNATFTSPASVTKVGIRTMPFSNGGLARVSIDADFTKANLLPTAQQVVNSGAYPNTILVANGGNCNPTDRVFDSYHYTSIISHAYDGAILFADNLTAGVHTVVVQPVNVARTVGGGVRVYVTGFSYATASTVMTTANVAPHTVSSWCNHWDSAQEFAYELTFPSTGQTFIGNYHGYEQETSFTCTVDGVATTLTAGQAVQAIDNIELTRVTKILQPNDLSLLADNIVVYHLDSQGLRVDVKTTWAKTASVQGAYAAMLTLNGASWSTGSQGDTCFTQVSASGYNGGPTTMTGSGNMAAASKSLAAWAYTGNYGALMFQQDYKTNVKSWAAGSPRYFGWLDSTGAGQTGYTKAYNTRVGENNGSPEAVANGTVWQSSHYYLFGIFPGGAAAALAA